MALLKIISFFGIFLLEVCHLGDSTNPLASIKYVNETRGDAQSSAKENWKTKGDNRSNIAQKQHVAIIYQLNRKFTC